MQDILEQAGLTPTEAKVYLALLEIGEAKTGEILSHAQLNSGRIYEVLDSLQQKGLVSTVTRKNVKHFLPSPPERVQDLLGEQKREIQRHENALQEVMPALQKKYASAKSDVQIEVFMGIEGQRTAYQILHEQADKDTQLLVHGIVAKEKYPPEIIDLLKYFVYRDRKDNNLHTRKLAAEEAREEQMYQQDDSEIRFLPYPTMMGFEVLGDVTMLMYEKEPIITVIIRSPGIADDYRSHFEFLWEHAMK